MIKRVCEERFPETAEQLGLAVRALAFGPDHVHVSVGACRNHGVAGVRRLKGASSRRILRKRWDTVKTKLWGEAFYSGGYFYRSVESTTGEAIQYYVQNSQKKHWTALDYEEYKHGKNTQTSLPLSRNP
jgi:REP element-mobilizing transposase RayT